MNFIKIRLIFSAMLAVLFASVAAHAQSADSKSHAREILDQARNALGGDAALKSIKSLSASGDFRSGTGSSQASGDVQVDFLLPDKLMRIMKWSPIREMKVTSVEAMDGSHVWTDSKEKNSSPALGNGPGGAGGMGRGGIGGMGRGGGGRRSAGGGGSGGSGSGAPKGIKISAPTLRDVSDEKQISWDFSCLFMGLLLHLPASSQVEISLENNDDIDGVTADYLKIDMGNGSVIRLAVDRKTHRPLMAAYMIPAAEEREKEANLSAPEMTKIQIYFSEYKPVAEKKFGNLWLPHQITKTRDGLTVEDMHIKKFELNPHLKPKQFEKAS